MQSVVYIRKQNKQFPENIKKKNDCHRYTRDMLQQADY